MSFSQHMTMNPRIRVNGDRATGTWYFFGPFTFRDGSQAKWQATRYHEEYARIEGAWKIKHLLVISILKININNKIRGNSGNTSVFLVPLCHIHQQ